MKLRLCTSALTALAVLVPICATAETLIRLDLPKDYSRLAVREMQAELGRIVEDARLDLRWQSAADRPADVNGRIVSVALLGECFGGNPTGHDRGPLGWTKTANGQVLPFVEISCSRVASLLDPLWRSESQPQRDLYFGRALARVLGHELAHALARTAHHADEGLRKTALSPQDLLVGTFRLAAADFGPQRIEGRRPVEPQLAEAPPTDSAASAAGFGDESGR